MDLAEENVHRALAYLVAVNRQGAELSRRQFETYANHPNRLITRSGGALYSATGIMTLARQMSQIFGDSAAESFTDYFTRLEWATITETGIRSTPLGQAVARALEFEDTHALTDIVTTVIDPDDPFSYVRTINTIAGLTDCLVVDPYLKLDQLIDLRSVGSVSRVLTSDETSAVRKKPHQKLDSFRLIARDAARPEVRVIPGKEAHDRYVIPSSGRVLQLSTSLNSMGSRFGVVTQMDEITSETVRTFHEGQWVTAQRLVDTGLELKEDPRGSDAEMPPEPA